jgi:hypothetical protein
MTTDIVLELDGFEGEPFYQKRATTPRPDWITTAQVTFPSGRTADEVVCTNSASHTWVVNLGCIDLNPWAVRSSDVDHPDELRIDLDLQPDASWDDDRQVALVARGCSRTTAWSVTPRHRARGGFISTCASNPDGRSSRCAWRPWRFHARCSVGRRTSRRLPGGRKNATAFHGLQP